MVMRRRALLAAPTLLALPARAQAFPVRPVRIIIPFAPGGGVDLLARAAAVALSQHWGQPVVVENRAGAGGIIGTEAVVRAPADGYTLLGTVNQTITSARFMYRALPYDPDRDLQPLCLMVQADQMIVAHPDVPVTDLKSLIALARAEPGKLTYGSFGIGTQPQLVMETLNRHEGLDILHVPYNGVAPLLVAATRGEVMLTTASAGVAGELLRAGRLKALANAGARRQGQFPAVPTTTEQGAPWLQASIWYAMFTPTGTPPEVAQKIGDDLRAVLRDPVFAERQATSKGLDLIASSGEHLAQVIRDEVPLVQQMIRAARIEPQ